MKRRWRSRWDLALESLIDEVVYPAALILAAVGAAATIVLGSANGSEPLARTGGILLVVVGLLSLRVVRRRARARAAASPHALEDEDLETVLLQPLTPEEVGRRRPVWVALSDLFLDTELQPDDHDWIARRLLDSGYDDAKLRRIFEDEVSPVLAINALASAVGAGVWAGFDEAWLEQSILEHIALGHFQRRRRRAHAGRALVDIEPVMRALSRLRQNHSEGLRSGPGG